MKPALHLAFFTAAALSTALGVTGATAGEAGVAASAAFDITGTAVNYATMAGAVGKDTAYAGSNATGDATAVLDSFAVGTGGAITFTGTNNYITSVAEDAARATVQANTMGVGLYLDFDATTGTADFNNP